MSWPGGAPPPPSLPGLTYESYGATSQAANPIPSPTQAGNYDPFASTVSHPNTYPYASNHQSRSIQHQTPYPVLGQGGFAPPDFQPVSSTPSSSNQFIGSYEQARSNTAAAQASSSLPGDMSEDGEISDTPREAKRPRLSPRTQSNSVLGQARQSAVQWTDQQTAYHANGPSRPYQTVTPSCYNPQAERDMMPDLRQQRENAKIFVLALHQSGYKFDDLVRAGLDATHLRGLLDELRLSEPTVRSPLSGPRNPIPLAQTSVDRASPSEVSAVQSSSEQRAGTKKNAQASVSREDYIARLLAAKTKKDSLARANDASAPGAAESGSSTAAPHTLQSPNATTGAKANDDRKAQLARLRREALESRKALLVKEAKAKAQRAATSNLGNSSLGESDPSVTSTSRRPGPTEIEIQPPEQQVSSHIAQSPATPSSAGIPGLFMTGPPPFGPAGIDPSYAESGSLLRKRPVASDFIGDPTHLAPRQSFGADRYSHSAEECIIEASDDESEHSTQERSMSQSGEVAHGHHPLESPSVLTPSAADQLLSDLSDKIITQAAQRHSSSTPNQTPGSNQNRPGLKAHELKILEMKKRIQLVEQRKKAKALNASRGGTPSKPQPFPKSDLPDASERSDNHAGLTADPIDEVSENSRLMRTASTPATALHPENPSRRADVTSTALRSEPLAAESADNGSTADRPSSMEDGPKDWRRKRKAEIEATLPTSDAKQAALTNQLQSLQSQLKQLQGREQENKVRLTSELQALGVDTDHIPESKLQETRDHIVANIRAGISKPSGITLSSSSREHDGHSRATSEDSNESGEIVSIHSSSEMQGLAEPASGFGHVRAESASEGEVIESSSASTPTSGNEADDELSRMQQTDGVQPQRSSSASDDESEHLVSDQSSAMEVDNEPELGQKDVAAEQNAPDNKVSQTSGRQSHVSNGSSEDMDVDSSNGSSGVSIASNARSRPSKSPRHDAEPGEVEELTERVPVSSALAHDEFIRAGSAADNAISLDSSDVAEDSEEYEPDDVEQPNERHESPIVVESDEDEDGEYEPPDPSAVAASLQQTTSLPSDSHKPTDDVADHEVPRLQPENQVEPAGAGTADYWGSNFAMGDFTPYDSPLRAFRRFRSHPEDADSSTGGLDNVTYSNSIDAQTPLCPFEASGGVCNDQQCQYQHFRSLHPQGACLTTENAMV